MPLTIAEHSFSSERKTHSQRMLELAQEAAREAVMESWLHGFPASALRDGQVVDVWPTDEELKRFPCYDMIANQVKRELASQASPPTTDN